MTFYAAFTAADQTINRRQTTQGIRKQSGHLFYDCTEPHKLPKGQNGWAAPCPSCRTEWKAMGAAAAPAPQAAPEALQAPAPSFAAPAAPAPAAPAARPNKFAGACKDCGQRVEAEAGSLAKGPAGWEIRHIGGCPAAPATPAPAAPTAPAAPAPAIPEGRYAIASSGDNDLVFYKVETSERWGTSVRMVVGGRVDTYVARRNIAGILARIASDSYARPEQDGHDEDGDYTLPAGSFAGPEGAALRYADEIGSCGRCGRHLTDRQSRLDGIGPVCITKD